MFSSRYIIVIFLFLVNMCYLEASEPKTMHMIFSTECNSYFDWQTLGMVHSFRKVGQAGKLTRLMACDRDHWEGTNIAQGGAVDTHIHPNWAVHPRTKDSYPAYNKPASIIHWLDNANVTAEYIIVLDADMILRRPFTIEDTGAKKGRPIAAHYGYLIGVFPQNHMGVKKKVKNVNLAQQVGGFVIMHVEDLRRVAPLWLKYTEEVRQDPDSWANTGDIFNDNGRRGPPWISEMYGYSFGCAEAGVTHQVSNKVMLYPGYAPPYPDPWPLVLHYGITYNIDDYAFDKHWHRSLDATTCPGKLFEKPMRKEDLRDPPGSMERRRKEVALDCAWGLFEATRDWKRDHCKINNFPEPEYKKYHCKVQANGVNICRGKTQAELKAPTPEYDDGCPAQDENEACCDWARQGECTANPGFMLVGCKHACGMCSGGRQESCLPQTPPPDYVPPSHHQQHHQQDSADNNKEAADAKIGLGSGPKSNRKMITEEKDEQAAAGGQENEYVDQTTEADVAIEAQQEADVEAEVEEEEEVEEVAPVSYHDNMMLDPEEERTRNTDEVRNDPSSGVEEEGVEEDVPSYYPTPQEDQQVRESYLTLGSVRIRTSLLFPFWGFAVLAFMAIVGVRGRQKKKGLGRPGARGGRSVSDNLNHTNRGSESKMSALSRLEALDKEATKGR